MKVIFQVAALAISFGGALVVCSVAVFVAVEIGFHLRERFEDWRR